MSEAGELTTFARDSALLERAREFLARGPAEPVPLIAYVCQLPKPPLRVAEHMAVALFERVRDIAREADGRWALASQQVSLHPLPPSGPAVDSSQWSRSSISTISTISAASLVPGVTAGAALAPPFAGVSPPLSRLTFAVVDVETTGTSALRGDRITEVAAVIVRDGEVVELWETLVNPERAIPAFITALTRITWDMVKHAPTFREIAADFTRVLDGRLFVAHNAAFDWRFVAWELQRATGERLLGERLCTVRLARAVLPQLRRRSLDALQNYFGVENAARHRAGGDALATARILLRLLEEAQSRGCTTLEDVRTITRPQPRRRSGRRRRNATPRWSDGDHTS